MIWMTWRQFRTQAVIAAVALAAVALTLILNGRTLSAMWTSTGLDACGGAACDSLRDGFLRRLDNAGAGDVFKLSVLLMHLVPPVIGLFWGAPLIARELETNAYRLVWTQSVTPARWLAAKLGLLGLTSMAVAAVLSAVAGWSGHLVDSAAQDRMGPLIFGARGLVPVGYAAFAFALGVTAGLVVRRSVPAMALTLGVYAAALLPVTFWLRAHLLPLQHVVKPMSVGGFDQLMIDQDTNVLVTGNPDLPGAWVVSNRTITAAGTPFDGVGDPVACGTKNGPPVDCEKWLQSLNLQQDITYQPAGRFWPLQWAETGLFLALAAALVAFAFWWLRRRAS